MAKQAFPPHQARIRQELLSAGVSHAALYKPQLRNLHQYIHADEHIAVVAYGTYGSGTGILVATDLRVMYIDRKPFSSIFDEFTYDIISGVALRQQGPLYTLTLHTPINNFTIHTANHRAAHNFITHMEVRRIEHVAPPPSLPVPHPT